MTPSLQDASSTLLDVLISKGEAHLSETEAAQVAEAAKTVIGSDIDTAGPASVILSSIRPMLVSQVGKMAEAFESRAVDAVEGLDEKYSKETMMTLYPALPKAVKAIIWIMVVASIVATGFLVNDTLQQKVVDYLDVATIGLLPIFCLFIFCTWPIKTLAYKSLEVGSKIVERQINNRVNKKTEEK